MLLKQKHITRVIDRAQTMQCTSWKSRLCLKKNGRSALKNKTPAFSGMTDKLCSYRCSEKYHHTYAGVHAVQKRRISDKKHNHGGKVGMIMKCTCLRRSGTMGSNIKLRDCWQKRRLVSLLEMDTIASSLWAHRMVEDPGAANTAPMCVHCVSTMK